MHSYQPLQYPEHRYVTRNCKISFITHRPLTRLLPNLSRNIHRNSVLRCVDLSMHRGGVISGKSNHRGINANCHSLMLHNQHCFLPLLLLHNCVSLRS